MSHLIILTKCHQHLLIVFLKILDIEFATMPASALKSISVLVGSLYASVQKKMHPVLGYSKSLPAWT